MLIYDGSASAPIGGGVSHYKSARRGKRTSIRVKALNRVRRTKRRSRIKRKLNVRNKKFLKTLGFRLKR